MYQEFFQKSPLLALPLAALFFFLLFFAGMLVRVLRQAREEVDALAAIPLGDAPRAPRVDAETSDTSRRAKKGGAR